MGDREAARRAELFSASAGGGKIVSELDLSLKDAERTSRREDGKRSSWREDGKCSRGPCDLQSRRLPRTARFGDQVLGDERSARYIG